MHAAGDGPAITLLSAAWPSLRPHLVPFRAESLDRDPLWRMLKLGLPIGGQMFLEFAVFGLIALLMGWLGTVPMAGHQVAINLASLTFMVPLGVAGATAVLVGNAVGRTDVAAAGRAARTALASGAVFMCSTALVFLTVPRGLARLYTGDPRVLSVAVALIPIAGVFQVFDGLQAVGAGVLRGLGDTRAPMVINVLGFWVIGLPVSIVLGFDREMGPVGLWWGFVAGLAAVAVFLLFRIRYRLRRGVRRVVIDRYPASSGSP